MKKNTKRKPNDLLLWDVQDQYETYLITTKTTSIRDALVKGINVAASKNSNSSIQRVEFIGSIDA